MKHLETLLADKRVGMVDAHPDDHLIHGNVLAIARKLGTIVHELTLTLGRNSTVNHRPDQDFVHGGRRAQEGGYAAERLGIASIELWDMPDGKLASHSEALIPAVRRWAEQHELDLILTMGGLRDHTDHMASAGIAAAAGRTIGAATLELQPAGEGDWYAPVTPHGLETTLSAATMHVSQFNQRNLSNLDQYPIRRDTTYIHTAGYCTPQPLPPYAAAML